MSDERLDRYLGRADRLLNQNIKQYQKPQKQWGGRTAEQMFDLNYQHMIGIREKTEITRDEKEEKLKDIIHMMRRPNYSPTEARKQLKMLSKTSKEGGGYANYFEGYGNMTQSDRRVLYEMAGSVFEHYNLEEVDNLTSGRIVQVVASLYNKGLTYYEIEANAVKILDDDLRNKNIEPHPETPLYEVDVY